MTLKQKKFARQYVKNGGNAAKAALEVYDANYDTAQTIGSVNLDKPVIIQEINRLLDKEGLNDDQWLGQNIRTAIDSGIGVKATNKDAIQMINMLLKVKNSYPSNRSTSVKLTLKGNMSQESIDTIIPTLTTLSTRSNELINDIK